MAQNRTNGGFVSNMYKILNAYKYFRILLHFGNHRGNNPENENGVCASLSCENTRLLTSWSLPTVVKIFVSLALPLISSSYISNTIVGSESLVSSCIKTGQPISIKYHEWNSIRKTLGSRIVRCLSKYWLNLVIHPSNCHAFYTFLLQNPIILILCCCHLPVFEKTTQAIPIMENNVRAIG